jgi:nucleotide-binding universal stress UspA family protein
MDIKNVLVPTDFSLPSRTALAYGVALARRFKARLTLFHVLDSRSLLWRAAEHNKDLSKQLREDAVQRLATLLAPEDEDDLDLQILLKSGTVSEEIDKAIEESGADIVVMGTHGRTGIGRWIIGSTTESLLRTMPVPVLTVSHATRPMNFERILFATDFSDASEPGFVYARDMARALQARLVVLHVLKTASLEEPLTPRRREVARETAQSKLAALVRDGASHGIDVEAFLAEGTPASEILRAAADNRADLILLNITARGTLERVLFGTTAEHIVKGANVPVLSIPVGVGMQLQRVVNRMDLAQVAVGV